MDADDVPLHPLLSRRSSPLAWDDDGPLPEAVVTSLVEAARWAPSAGNSQPWGFIVGRRGDAVHERLVRHLAPSSARWAPGAGLLVAHLCHRHVEGTDWDYSEFAEYDVGQAAAYLTVQAQHLGLGVRQFRAFDRDALEREFAVPAHWQVLTMAAVGHAADGGVPAGSPAVVRDRKPLEQILWPAVTDER